MKNNKGFTLIELLGVVVILGILTGVAIPAVSKYLQRSKNESYDVMITSIHDGAMSYMMDKNEYPVGEAEIDIGVLEDAGYVESLADPGSSGKCSGQVKVRLSEAGGTTILPEYEYKIELNCPSKTITKIIIS